MSKIRIPVLSYISAPAGSGIILLLCPNTYISHSIHPPYTHTYNGLGNFFVTDFLLLVSPRAEAPNLLRFTHHINLVSLVPLPLTDWHTVEMPGFPK